MGHYNQAAAHELTISGFDLNDDLMTSYYCTDTFKLLCKETVHSRLYL